MSERSYYEILEVSRDCSQEELTSAYRKLAVRYHPDKNPEGTELFKELTKAYKVLNDPEARRMYDLGGVSSLLSAFSDFFNRFGYHHGEMEDLLNPTPKKKNENSVHCLDVSLETIYSGGCVPIEIYKTSPCTLCKGRRNHGCSSCCETKIITRKKIHDINIKKGSLNGQNIYFIGEGNCTKDTSPGDIIIQINILQHPVYKVTPPHDLQCYQDISLSLAVFGGWTKITTLDHRNLRFWVPPGIINNETRKIIRNEGMPNYFNPEKKGNLILIFRVDLTSLLDNGTQLSKLRSILPSTTSGKNSFRPCKSRGDVKELQGPVTSEDIVNTFQEKSNNLKEKFYCRPVSWISPSMILLLVIIFVGLGIIIAVPTILDEMDDI